MLLSGKLLPYVTMRNYAASGASLHHLRKPRQIVDTSGPIDDKRVYDMAVALLQFRLVYGDLISWL